MFICFGEQNKLSSYYYCMSFRTDTVDSKALAVCSKQLVFL